MNKRLIKFIKRCNPAILLWPATCPFCGRVYRRGICKDCQKKIDLLEICEPKCMQCGKPITQQQQEYCYDCRHTIHQYDRGISLWVHRPPVSMSIYRFKYHNQRCYGIYYATEVFRRYGGYIRAWHPDLIIPIPLHPKKRRKRGYNQAEILAVLAGRQMHIPVDTVSLIRKRDTTPQKLVSHAQRRSNLKQAFLLKESFQPVNTVLIVDDIYTTGNTIDAAANLLKKAGVRKIYFLTISIGQGY